VTKVAGVTVDVTAQAIETNDNNTLCKKKKEEIQ
jgi:hypothetical protein